MPNDLDSDQLMGRLAPWIRTTNQRKMPCVFSTCLRYVQIQRETRERFCVSTRRPPRVFPKVVCNLPRGVAENLEIWCNTYKHNTNFSPAETRSLPNINTLATYCRIRLTPIASNAWRQHAIVPKTLYTFCTCLVCNRASAAKCSTTGINTSGSAESS